MSGAAARALRLASVQLVADCRSETGWLDYVFPSDIDGWPISNMAMLMCMRRLKGRQEALSAFRAALHKIELENRAPTEMGDAIFRVALRFLAIDPEIYAINRRVHGILFLSFRPRYAPDAQGFAQSVWRDAPTLLAGV